MEATLDRDPPEADRVYKTGECDSENDTHHEGP